MVHASPDAGSRPLVRALGLALAVLCHPDVASAAVAFLAMQHEITLGA